MDNFAIAENFSLLSKLMDIHGENAFRSRTYSIAAFNIEKLPVQLSETAREELFSIKGIGESIGKKVVEMLDTGKLSALQEIIEKTPAGVIEMLHIKGIGPKKIHTIWQEMGIESIGELQYACNENRLTHYKGFGEKTQQNILESIEFYFRSQGHFLYAEAEALFPSIDGYLKKMFTPEKVHITGAYRRQALTIEELEFVIALENEKIKPAFQTAQPPELLEETKTSLVYKLKNGLKLRLYTGHEQLAPVLFETTGNKVFVDAFKKQFPNTALNSCKTEEEIFEKAGISFVEPCLRETTEMIEKARKKKLPVLITEKDIRGIIHNHSNWSDGVNTIEQMAEACMRKGIEYLVLSDHSKSAGYANGLREDRIRDQHKQIDSLNKQYAPFRIFKSIESDILNDGSLDYDPETLRSFDLVIASVHSNLKMSEEKAMSRLIRAIENPYTTILGHMTGRLLLSRNGYPVDHQKVIDACAANHVIIEINANPHRLDIDWQWIAYAMEKNVLLSIDPDAHSLEGFNDVRYGVLAAQKGGLTKEFNLSSFDLVSFEAIIRKKNSANKAGARYP
jgi:DNA polymerase (family X)